MLKKKYYYTAPKCVITVLADPIAGGIVSGGGLFNYGDTTLIHTTPNSGYNFVLWDDGYRELDRNILITTSKTYTAQYTNASAPFTVTFDLNGHGTGSAPSALTLDSITGFYATKPEDPTDTDYVFNGWFTTATGGSQWSFANDEVKCNITLYAGWVLNYYKATLKFPISTGSENRPLIGYLYSGDFNNPKGSEILHSQGGSRFSICCVNNDTVWGRPRIHETSWYTTGYQSQNSICIVAVEEGTINSGAGLQLKGFSISCINNGQLLYAHGIRIYDMPGTSVHTRATCKYYEFIIPPGEDYYNIMINTIWEPIT